VSGNTAKYGAAAVDRGLEALFAQRSVPLLGRTINLHDLLAAEVQRLVAANAGHLIARFEASSVSSSVELESQVAVLRAAHSELEELIPLSSWDAVWTQADHDGLSNGVGRVARHAAEDICQDVLSQFAMDSTAHRFVRVVPDRKGRTSGPVPPTPSLPGFLFCREGKPGSPGHKTLVAQYSGWFGAPHADALLRLIGPAGLVGLVEGVRERLQYVLKFVLPASLKTAAGALASQLPAATSAQALVMPSNAALSFYRSHLSAVLGYQALRDELASGVAEVGNAVMLVLLIDDAVNRAGTRQFLMGAPYFGIRPAAGGGLVRPAASQDDNPDGVPLDRLFATLSDDNDAPGDLLKEVTNQFWAGTERRSLLRSFLEELEEPAFSSLGTLYAASKVEAGANCGASFHNVLSALIFMLAEEGAPSAGSREPGAPSPTGRTSSLLGDSLAWGSATLLRLLKQDNKWSLEDYSGVVIRAAELEGLIALGRPTEHGGGRLPSSAVVAMAANAHKIRASIGSAIAVLRQAKPPPKRPAVPFPCFTGASLSASQAASKDATGRVWIPTDPVVNIPELRFEAVPEVRPGQDSGCEVYGAIEGADAETEPASPASTSIRSVTTAQASPQSLVSGSVSGGIQGRGHSMPSSALFPLPTVRELQGGEQEGGSAEKARLALRDDSTSAQEASTGTHSQTSPSVPSMTQSAGQPPQGDYSAYRSGASDMQSDTVVSPRVPSTTEHSENSPRPPPPPPPPQQPQQKKAGEGAQRKRRMLPPPPQHLRTQNSSAPSSVADEHDY